MLRGWVKSLALSAAIVIAAGKAAFAIDPQIVEAAKKEGTVVWYVGFVQNQLVRPLVAAFEKKYPGIKVETVGGMQGDLLIRLLSEGKAGKINADVYHGTSVVGPLAKQGLVESYKPDSAADYPPEYKDPNGLWTAAAVYFMAPSVNTDMVAPGDEPKSYKDLLDPKWQGQIAWTTSLAPGGPPGFIATVLQTMGQDAGRDYLKKLAAQKIRNIPSNQRVVTDQVIAGQYPLALMTFTHHAEISAGKGAPVKWLKVEPLPEILDVVLLMKNSPHPNAGKVLLDYIVSPEGQQIFRDADYIPASPDVKAKSDTLKPDTGNFKTLVLSPQSVDENFDKWVEIYNQLYR